MNINNPNNIKSMISLTNNNTTKNMRSSLNNFKTDYNTDNSNGNVVNKPQPRIINNDQKIGFIAASHAHTKNMRKEGKYYYYY